MDSSEATLARERCTIHPDRSAVGVCERCRRLVCLDCAIPFRGAVRCEQCAALELGDPAPEATADRPRILGQYLALLFLLLGLAATIPPWHRSGTLTTVMSAWSFVLDPWAAFGCVAVAAGSLGALLAVLRPDRARFSGVAAALGVAGAISIAVSLAREPSFFSATLAPVAALVASLAAAVVSALLALRRPRP